MKTVLRLSQDITDANTLLKTNQNCVRVLNQVGLDAYLCYDASDHTLIKMNMEEIHRDKRVRNMFSVVGLKGGIWKRYCVPTGKNTGQQLLSYNARRHVATVVEYHARGVLVRNLMNVTAEELRLKSCASIMGYTKFLRSYEDKFKSMTDAEKFYEDNVNWYSVSSSPSEWVLLNDLCNEYADCTLVAVTLDAIPNIIGNTGVQLDSIRGANAIQMHNLLLKHLNNVSPKRFRLAHCEILTKFIEPAVTDYVYILAVKNRYTNGMTREGIIEFLNGLFEQWHKNEKITSYVDDVMTYANS